MVEKNLALREVLGLTCGREKGGREVQKLIKLLR